MTINGIDLEFSIFDADCVERYENAIKKMQEQAVDLPDNSTASEAIRRECEIYIAFFDEVFGEGTSYSIFNGRTNIASCHDAFYQVIEQIEAEGEERKKINAIRNAKYGAENWREQTS